MQVELAFTSGDDTIYIFDFPSIFRLHLKPRFGIFFLGNSLGSLWATERSLETVQMVEVFPRRS